MKLYSYIVKHDTGFAPNPFWGYCTVACCKPEIRRTAHVGDWVVGLTPKAQGNHIVYFMRVDEILSFDAYWRDRRFGIKRPRYDDGLPCQNGDNIYEPQPSGEYRQLRSWHSLPEHGDRENPKRKAHDLDGRRVLVSETFAYFGSKPLELPEALQGLIVGRGHRCMFSDEVKTGFIRFTGSTGFGVHAAPRSWPSGDDSWVKACGGVAIKR